MIEIESKAFEKQYDGIYKTENEVWMFILIWHKHRELEIEWLDLLSEGMDRIQIETEIMNKFKEQL